MFTKRHRVTLLFNANKAYDRQVVEGVGEYLQASQSEWDIFIEEDFRARIDKIKDWLGDDVGGVCSPGSAVDPEHDRRYQDDIYEIDECERNKSHGVFR